jgi:hypothetical protein
MRYVAYRYRSVEAGSLFSHEYLASGRFFPRGDRS